MNNHGELYGIQWNEQHQHEHSQHEVKLGHYRWQRIVEDGNDDISILARMYIQYLRNKKNNNK